MGTTPVCTISATGIERPSFATVLAWATAQFQAIYGADVYLGSDSQDGQWVGLLAAAIDDANAMAVAAYNAFSPASAQGVGLSSVVKINGLQRKVPSYSTAPILVGGQAGTTITAGLVSDEDDNVWALPATVVIPNAAQILVTGTCQTEGAISAPLGTITEIENSQPGWQTASNTTAATPGAPVEIDAQLRQRQSLSTMNSSTGLTDGLVGAILALPNVARAVVYENDGSVPDGNGIPGHTIAAVIDGGDVQAIATTIKTKKGGAGTYGTTSQTVTDAQGISSQVNFFVLAEPQITWAIAIKTLAGFTTDVEALIQNSLSAWTNTLGIGKGIQWNRAYAAAYLFGDAQSDTFEIQSIAVARDGQVPTQADVTINFYEAATCVPANVTVSIAT